MSPIEAGPSTAGELRERGIAALRQRDFAAASRWLEQAIAEGDDSALTHGGLGLAHLELRQFDRAQSALRRALEIDPKDHVASANLGVLMLKVGQLHQAEECFRRSMDARPGYWHIYHGLAMAMQMLGRMDDALAHRRKALSLAPDDSEVHAALIFVLELTPGITLAELQLERRRWYDRHARPRAGSALPFSNTREPGRKLRIGYVSADFRIHSAAMCFGPIIRYHAAAEFESYCYSGAKTHDVITESIRNAAHGWRDVAGLSDDALEALIRQDHIDILVDLSGHTAGHRLFVFARKPAPVQVTAWGFATGTGMPTIDYMFSDPVSIPAENRSLFTEHIFDLPCCICYEAPGDAPPGSALPSLNGQPFTFGCINRTEKISDPAVALWARILHGLPGSRLLLKSGTQGIPEVRDAVLEKFQRHQVGADRLILLGATDIYEHLKALHQVDLALDPFPAGGGITTAETLWMGVPVVTLLGNTPHGRNSAAILTAVGMPDWIANDEDEYVRIALDFAEDIDHLARIRGEMRGRLLNTDVFHARRYTRAVEAAYRTMWRRWCSQAA